MQARRLSRELALLSMSQLPTQPQNLEAKTIEDMVLAAVRSLQEEVKEMLTTAGAELSRGQEKLLASELRAADLESVRALIQAAIDLTETAINRVGVALDFPELIQVSRQADTREYAVLILQTIHQHRAELDNLLNSCLEGWQMHRLSHIDQALLRIATAEMRHLDIPPQVAINEAVELAKRYSTEDGFRFINGVLRGVANKIKKEQEMNMSF
ncbi:MAG: transcription antitermination factor NusB [Pseudanabaenaceae cyanobacterium SKYGB_i_bin29]|nr:transcription antitermination factor NusB [Pseudanabaenaceae cyanobacterium SKYG29]MDW8422158.1 transcription antitermination factor NusB [Pseudanabaenaceae cyanobacterium SKYGB_i_bin29]